MFINHIQYKVKAPQVMQGQKKLVRIQCLNSPKVLNFVTRPYTSLKQIREEIKKLQIDLLPYVFMTGDRTPIAKASQADIALSAILVFGSIFYVVETEESKSQKIQEKTDIQEQKWTNEHKKIYDEFKAKIGQLKQKLHSLNAYFGSIAHLMPTVDPNYQGQINQFGLYDGIGRYRYPNNEVYIGQFRNGSRNGLGFYTFVNGNRYEGQYTNNDANGFGIEYFNNGDSMAAVYHKNKSNGIGIKYFANGDRLQGKFVDNFLEGRALKVLADGTEAVQYYARGFQQKY